MSPAGRVCVFVRSFAGGGGAERAMLNVATGLAERGHAVDLAMARRRGNFLEEIPDALRVVELGTGPRLAAAPAVLRELRDAPRLALALLGPGAPAVVRSVPRLAAYLRRERPRALLAALNYTSVAALLAHARAGSDARAVISIQNHFSSQVAGEGGGRSLRALPDLARRFFPRADAVVASSRGVAEDLACATGVPRERIVPIHNPVRIGEVRRRAREPAGHAWLDGAGPPVVLAAGKLKPQKDFPTLLRAFARLRRRREARLVVLGEGAGRQGLETLARELGVAADVALPGFVSNPFAFMARSALFALSSAWEGFANVIVEALACGCPVVSTDCPSGPGEILEGGRFGRLVPVGDPAALAEAIRETLEAPPDREALRKRAEEFGLEIVAERYAAVLGLEPAGEGREGLPG